jgi:4-amino-4-deoxy-L-arabinose transferase-like glycosyltransferase
MSEPQSQSADRHVGRLAIAALVCLILLSAFIGTRRLSHSLDSDEFFHTLAARSLVQNGTLQLAPYVEREYTRARFTTYFVALSYLVFGDNERAARMPSVLFTVLLVPLLFVVGRRLFRTSVGLWAGAIAVFLPTFIEQGRVCRMYPQARLFALLAAFLLFLVLDRVHAATMEGRPWSGTLRRLLSASGIATVLGALVTFALAYHLQPIALVLGVGIAAYAAYLVIAQFVQIGVRRTVCSPLFLIIVIGGVGAAAFALGTDLGWEMAMRPFTKMAAWASDAQTDPLMYHRQLRRQSELLYALLPVGVILALARGRRENAFPAIVFTVTLLLMTAFRWKQMRFLSVHMGTFVLVCAFGADVVARSLRRVVADWLPPRMAWAAVPLVVVGALGAWIAAGIPQNVPYSIHEPTYTYRAAFDYVKERRAKDEPVIARLERAALYYLGTDRDYPLYKLAPTKVSSPNWIPDSAATLSELRKVVPEAGAAWVVVEKENVTLVGTDLTLVDKEVRKLLQTLEPAYKSPDRTVFVYRLDTSVFDGFEAESSTEEGAGDAVP